jgi:hypothetical protein
MNNLTTSMPTVVNAGIDQSRVFLSLDQIFATATPNYSVYDIYVSRLQAGGVHGIGVLTGTPPALGATFCTPPSDPQKWATLAASVVARMEQKFPGVIQRYEVWNEPDATGTLCPSTLSTYLGIYAAAGPAIRAQTKAAIGGPTLAIPSRNLSWISSLLSNPATAPYVDFVSYHVYLTGLTDISNGLKWAGLFADTQSTTGGIAQYYTRVSAMTAKPIIVSEYNTNWAFATDCCRNDPTYSPLWNAVVIVDHLNTIYSGAKAVPTQLVYFNASSHSKYFCVVGLVDTAMDCDPSGTAPYPQLFAFKLFSSYLGLHDGGHMAASMSASGVTATAFYTKTTDDVVLINPNGTDTSVTVAINNPGLAANQATSYQLSKSQITTSLVALNPAGANYTSHVTVPAYSVVAIALTPSLAKPASGLTVTVSP